MIDSPRARLLLLTGSFVALFGLLVWYGSLGPAPSHGIYPDESEVLSDTDRRIGEVVTIEGPVVETDPLMVRISAGDASRRILVTGTDITVEKGDTARAFGTLTDPTTLRAESAFTVPPSGFVYTYVVSFLAGLWVLARLVRRLDFDRDELALVVGGDRGGDDA